MLTKNQRRNALRTVYTMKRDLEVLLCSLSEKDDKLSKLEGDETLEEAQLPSNERFLRIESLAYDIISDKDVPFLDSIQQLTEDYFDEPIPREV